MFEKHGAHMLLFVQPNRHCQKFHLLRIGQCLIYHIVYFKGKHASRRYQENGTLSQLLAPSMLIRERTNGLLIKHAKTKILPFKTNIYLFKSTVLKHTAMF